MKKINIIILMVLGLLMSVSCDSDRDSNPTLLEPSGFVLNVPPYASNDMDLINTSVFELTTSQPDYGFTAAVSYSVQVSLNDTWTDATEGTKASYGTLETLFTTARMGAIASEMARVIVDLSGWTDKTQLPDGAISVYVRLKAQLGSSDKPVYSNSVELSVVPYFVLLKDALPAPYYLVGACIGDGKWTNSDAGLGVSLIPMAMVDGYSYDKTTGQGAFVYTGYFPAGEGFKLVGVIGDWADQWGNDGSQAMNNLTHKDGVDNIVVPTSGWYTVSLNTLEDKLTIEATDNQPAGYTSMVVIGSFNGWADAGTYALTKSGGDNSHVWYGNVTFAEDAEIKFRSGDNWFGGDVFPYGTVTGNNLKVEAGTYFIIFNDLDKCYYFIEQTEE